MILSLGVDSLRRLNRTKPISPTDGINSSECEVLSYLIFLNFVFPTSHASLFSLSFACCSGKCIEIFIRQRYSSLSRLFLLFSYTFCTYYYTYSMYVRVCKVSLSVFPEGSSSSFHFTFVCVVADRSLTYSSAIRNSMCHFVSTSKPNWLRRRTAKKPLLAFHPKAEIGWKCLLAVKCQNVNGCVSRISPRKKTFFPSNLTLTGAR